MTPFEIDIPMYYYCSPHEHDVVARNPPIWAETRDFFLAEGLLELRQPDQYSATYRATERCTAYIKGLCAVPLPVHAWVIPPAEEK